MPTFIRHQQQQQQPEPIVEKDIEGGYDMNQFYGILVKAARATHATMWLTLAAFVIFLLIELHI